MFLYKFSFITYMSRSSSVSLAVLVSAAIVSFAGCRDGRESAAVSRLKTEDAQIMKSQTRLRSLEENLVAIVAEKSGRDLSHLRFERRYILSDDIQIVRLPSDEYALVRDSTRNEQFFFSALGNLVLHCQETVVHRTKLKKGKEIEIGTTTTRIRYNGFSDSILAVDQEWREDYGGRKNSLLYVDSWTRRDSHGGSLGQIITAQLPRERSQDEGYSRRTYQVKKVFEVGRGLSEVRPFAEKFEEDGRHSLPGRSPGTYYVVDNETRKYRGDAFVTFGTVLWEEGRVIVKRDHDWKGGDKKDDSVFSVRRNPLTSKLTYLGDGEKAGFDAVVPANMR
jgi:hypothetical protein